MKQNHTIRHRFKASLQRGETSVFKTTVDLVAKKFFLRFYTRSNFYNFREKSIPATIPAT